MVRDCVLASPFLRRVLWKLVVGGAGGGMFVAAAVAITVGVFAAVMDVPALVTQ